MNLPTMAEVAASRAGKSFPKGQPRVVAQEARKKAKGDQGKRFRDEVWARDRGLCRATGKPLSRSGTIDPEHLGEVDHSIPRSLAPERIYDTSNGLLLQKKLNRLRKAACLHAPEHRYFDYSGPDNRALPQTFRWRNDDGKVIRETKG